MGLVLIFPNITIVVNVLFVGIVTLTTPIHIVSTNRVTVNTKM